MNRRDFLKYFVGGATATALAPAGFLLPNTLFKLPQQWDDLRADQVVVSLVDTEDRIFASQLCDASWEVATLVPKSLRCIWTPEMLDLPERGCVLKHALASIEHPMSPEAPRVEVEIDTSSRTRDGRTLRREVVILPDFGPIELEFNPKGICSMF